MEGPTQVAGPLRSWHGGLHRCVPAWAVVIGSDWRSAGWRVRTHNRAMTRVRMLAMAMLLVLCGSCSGDDDDRAASAVTTGASTASGPTTTTGNVGGRARAVDLSGVGLHPLTASSDGQSVWLAGSGPEGGRVLRIDTEAGRVAWSVAVPDSVVGLAIDTTTGLLWAVGGGDGADPDGGITRLDGASGEVLGTLEVPGGSPYGVAAGPTAVWVTDASSDRVWKVDRAEGAIVATAHLEKAGVAIAFGHAGDTLWVASPGGLVTRLDATTGAVRGTLSVPTTANSVVANPSAVWVGGDQLVRLDPATGKQVAQIPARGVTAVQGLSHGWVWGREVGGAIVRGDVEGLRLEARPLANGEFTAIAVAGDAAWVYEPDRPRLVEKRLPVVSDLDFPAEKPRDGDNVGYIREFGDDSIVFDPIESLVSPKATEVAVLDGVGITAEEGIPNDYYDRNRDGRTYRLPIRPETKFLVIKSGSDLVPSEVDRLAFQRALSPTGTGEFYGAPGRDPFRLTIEDGQVVRAHQIYRP